MIQEFGEFAVRYSEDLSHVIIAYTTIASALIAHIALHQRLNGLLKPTGEYSHMTLHNNVFFGIHFENTIPEERLREVLTQ